MAGRTKECACCGVGFGRPRKLSATQWANRRFCSRRCAALKRDDDDQIIVDRYLAGESAGQIAAAIGLTNTQVARIIKPFGVTRSASERQKLNHARPEVRQKMSLAKAGRPCPEHVKEILRQIFGPRHPLWKGGVTHQSAGYPTYTASRANGDKARKSVHVVVAEQKIGRRLLPGEVVHHDDKNKRNPEPSNLYVMTRSAHARLHALENKLGHRKR